ncbi:MAG: enoyl-ACP reductase [Nanoarchaeota archaeon]|nr:enoyl-ACP reductase [Nanoarchaeota archaeon]
MVDLGLKGKKAVVFGVADENSVAWHIVKALNEEEVRVAIAYQERAEDSVLALVSSLKNSIMVKCDVTDDSLLDNFFKKVKKEFGTIDFLIHSVAFAKKDFLKGKFFEVDRKGYKTSQEVSAYSLVEITRRAYPLLNKEGSIIAMTYMGSTRVFSNYNVMGVCKAALEASVRYLANDVGDKGIRVNAISFSPIRTRAASGISGFEEHLKEHKKIAPLKRNIHQEDVANLALFLCSDLSKNITGQTIFVDAGYGIMGSY